MGENGFEGKKKTQEIEQLFVLILRNDDCVSSVMGIYKTFILLTVLEVGSLRLCGSICSHFGEDLPTS